MENNKHIGKIIARSLQWPLSKSETAELDDWMEMSTKNLVLYEELTDPYNARWAEEWFKQAGIEASVPKQHPEHWYRVPTNAVRQLVYIMSAAAAVILVVGLSFYPFDSLQRRSDKEYPSYTFSLIFKENSLKEIARQLSEQYHVNVQYEGTRTGTYTGTIPKGYTLQESLDALSRQIDIDYKIIGKDVILIDKIIP